MSCVGLLDGQVEATVVVCKALELASSLHYLSSRPVCVCDMYSALGTAEPDSFASCVFVSHDDDTYVYVCVWGDVNVCVRVSLSLSLSLCIIYI